jgi:hypothetical protein
MLATALDARLADRDVIAWWAEASRSVATAADAACPVWVRAPASAAWAPTYHPVHTHIMRWEPAEVLAMLPVIEAANRWRRQCMTVPRDAWDARAEAIERAVIAALDALPAQLGIAGFTP